MTTTGESTNDFAQILSDFSRTLSYQVVTKATDGMGNETDTWATASNVSAIFLRNTDFWMFTKEGFVELADAYIITALTTSIKKFDRFTVDGETFYVKNVTKRYALSTAMMDYGECYKVQ